MQIATQRIENQRIEPATLTSPEAVVEHLGAMQAQDFAMSKWAIGCRLPGGTDAQIERAIAESRILRTHILRPTWHWVAASDIRWMLALTAPHIRRVLAGYYRMIGLSEETYQKCNPLIAKMLENGPMTRAEIRLELGRHGIPNDEYKSVHLMFSAELDGIVCSGPTKGKQQTYALLDQCVPPSPEISREEGLAKLALRYFKSHGPATLKDFTWWSGLPAGEARRGLELAKTQLFLEKIDGKEFWFSENGSPEKTSAENILLLPAFDEFLVSYADRTATLDPGFGKLAITQNGIFKPVIVRNGQTIGMWKRSFKKGKVILEAQYFRTEDALPGKFLQKAAEPFGYFLGLEVELA